MLTVVFVSVVVVLAVVPVRVTVDSVTELDEDVTRLVLECVTDVVLLVAGCLADFDDFSSAFFVRVVVATLAFPVDALGPVEVGPAVLPACVEMLLFWALVCDGLAVVLKAVADVLFFDVGCWAGRRDFSSAFCVLVVVGCLALLADALVTVAVVLDVLLARVVLLLSETSVCEAPIVKVDESAAEVVRVVALVELREEVGGSEERVREAVVVGARCSLVAAGC